MKQLIVILFIFPALLAAQPRFTWPQLPAGTAQGQIARTGASPYNGQWVDGQAWVDSILYARGAVYGSGTAGYLAEWLNDSTLQADATGAYLTSVGTTAQRPTGAVGLFRYNTTTGWYEGYDGSNWYPLSLWSKSGTLDAYLPSGSKVGIGGTPDASYALYFANTNDNFILAKNSSGYNSFIVNSTQLIKHSAIGNPYLFIDVSGSKIGIGVTTTGGTPNLGTSSTAVGNSSNASGVSSSAFGQQTQATGANSLSFGGFSSATNSYSGVFGYNLRNSTTRSILIGIGNSIYYRPTASNSYSIQMGGELGPTFSASISSQAHATWTRGHDTIYVASGSTAIPQYTTLQFVNTATQTSAYQYAPVLEVVSSSPPTYVVDTTNLTYSSGVTIWRPANSELASVRDGALGNVFTWNLNKSFTAHNYGDGRYTGTETYLSSWDADGNNLETAPGWGLNFSSNQLVVDSSEVATQYDISDRPSGRGEGVATALAYWTDANTLDAFPWYYDSGNVGLGLLSPLYSLDGGNKTDGFRLPNGTTAQRPTGANGVMRYNSTTGYPEVYYNSAWNAFGGATTWLSPELVAGNVTINSHNKLILKSTIFTDRYTEYNYAGITAWDDATGSTLEFNSSSGLYFDIQDTEYQNNVILGPDANNRHFFEKLGYGLGIGIDNEILIGLADDAGTQSNAILFSRGRSTTGPVLSAAQAGDELGGVYGSPSYTSTFNYGRAAGISFVSTENTTGTAWGTKIDFYTTPNTTTTSTKRLTIDQNGDLIAHAYDDTKRDSAAHLVGIQEATGKLVPIAQVNVKYMEDSDLTLTAAEIYKFQEVRVWMSTTAGATSQTELTIPDAAAVFLNTKIVVVSKDASGTYNNLINTATATMYDAGSDASSYPVAAGKTVVLWCVQTGASTYRWAIQQ